MDQHEKYNKVNELIAKFENGEELYNKNATFNRVIQMMVNGVTEFQIIEQLINMLDINQNAFQDYMMRDTRPWPFTENN